MEKFHLRANPDFFKQSEVVRTRAFSLYFRNNSLHVSRYAVVVPKKIIPLSTGRNILKRRIVSELQKNNFRDLPNDMVLRVANSRFLQNSVTVAYELKSVLDKAYYGL